LRESDVIVLPCRGHSGQGAKLNGGNVDVLSL
jgi:hypothetical protein